MILQILVAVFATVSIIISIPLFLQLRWPTPVLWFLKLYVSALSQILALIGALATLTGLLTGSIIITVIGLYVLLVYCRHIFLVTRPPDSSTGFEHAFGSHWEGCIRPNTKQGFLHGRMVFKLPAVPKPRIEHNVVFATLPATGRKLFCDVWQPPLHIRPSGLALIYLHGSAWYLLDKDLGTRPMFSHLAAQGHLIMDVAYRLAPETDMMGMIHDVKRAIAWMKSHASSYGVDPNRIVVSGGSAGGQFALMTAYTINNLQFTPEDLEGTDSSVCAVISLYGPADLEAMYYHTNQHLTTRSTPDRATKAVPTKMPDWLVKTMGKDFYRLGFDKDLENAGALAPLLGGHPDECPETFALYSPVTHVHAECPPTLLIHGADDVLAPVLSTRLLYARLVEQKVPAVLHLLPQTEHAFDLQLPTLSHSAHNAIYDVERFLALMMMKEIKESKTRVSNLAYSNA